MSPKVHILMPVHNRCAITVEFARCLQAQQHMSFQLVLLDDGSTDGTAAAVQDVLGARVTVLRGTGNWWWGGALQHGYRYLQRLSLPPDDVVLIINDDTRVAPDFLERACQLLASAPHSVLGVQAVQGAPGNVVDPGVHVDWRRLEFRRALHPSEVNCLSTRGLFLRMEDFLHLGGFLPRILPHHLADYEFTMRAARHGMRLWTDPRLTLEMVPAPSPVQPTSFLAALRWRYSRRCPENPWTLLTFVTVACPWRYKALNIARISKTEAALVPRLALRHLWGSQLR